MVTVQVVFATDIAWRLWLTSEDGATDGWSWDRRQPPERNDIVLTCNRGSGLLVFKEVGCRARADFLEPGDRFEDLAPPVFLRDVMRRCDQATPRNGRAFVGADAEAVLAALEAEQKAHPHGPVRREGKRRTREDLQRDRSLRTAAVDATKGVCPGCDTDYVSIFGQAGWRVFDRHHVERLAGRARKGTVETALDDLVAVCPACHRLLSILELDDPADLAVLWAD